ncbi:hypothetical protein EU527_17660 [Candidatus Thorarchaeota archaeon]|nr:MAG: hypothetical protein EU527_17660 [Candidatus Thorarchaeota archaeon]
MSPQSELDFMGMQRSVPLFSSQLGSGLIILAIFWALVLRVVLFIAGVVIDFLLWIVLTILVGSLMLIAWSLWKRKRFCNPVTDRGLLNLYEEVKRDLGKGDDIELWYREIDRQVFMSASDIFFKALLFSESAIADILEKPDKGKMLLAKEVLKVEKERPTTRFLLSVLGFTLFSLLESLFLLDFIEVLFFSFGTALLTIIVITVVVLLVIIPVLRTGQQDNVDEIIEQLYGFPPDAAMFEVFYGLPISDEMLHKAKEEKEENPGQRRIALRKATIATLIVSPIAFIIFYISQSAISIVFILTLFMTIVVSAGAFIIVYMTSFMWPLLSMGRRERSTEWDIQIPLAQEVQTFLNHQGDSEQFRVVGVKYSSDDDYGLVILRLQPTYSEESVYGVAPSIVKELHDVELLGPLIFSELEKNEIERKERRMSYCVLAVAFPFLAICILWLLINTGLYGFLTYLLQILFVYLIISLVPLGLMTYWKRMTIMESEIEIIRGYPKYREALEILIKHHYTLPYGMTSYKTRLERID